METGTVCTFKYPEAFTSLNDYTAHRGQQVTVLHVMPEHDATMYAVRAADGWVGYAFADELEVR